MSYATEFEFVALIGAKEVEALADPENTGSAVAGRVQSGLDAATADINTILGARAATADAAFLRVACIHIARWHLSGTATIENDPITARHKHYTDLLRDMADGVIGNGGTGASSGEPHYGAAVMAAPTPERLFSRQNRR